MSKIITYYDTVRHLKPTQISSRLVSKFKSKTKPAIETTPITRPLSLSIPELDMDAGYIERFSPVLAADNKATILNHIYDLNFDQVTKEQVSPLVWFNLQYFEYAIAWAALYKLTKEEVYVQCFQSTYERYLEANVPYAPYVISLQIPNLLISMELFDQALDEEFRDVLNIEIYRQYQYLQEHLETHLLGNHYFENLKALVIGAYYFGDDKKLSKYLKLLERQVDEQILLDGMHFELSPMYHKIILEDLLRISKLGLETETKWLKATIQKMLSALVVLENGFDRTPLFNDSGDNVAKSKEALIAATKRCLQIEPERLSSLPYAGYYKLDDGRLSLLIDGGKIGPDYMPGHGHCDCLSFELAVDGEMLLVNAGTYQYQGNKRKYFRSTRAHNTVVMDGHEQSQCWGEHRVAKRISHVKSQFNEKSFNGEYINYCGQKHIRNIELKDDELIILDSTDNANQVVSYLHVAPGYKINGKYQILRDEQVIATIIPIGCEATITEDRDLKQYAPEFGSMETGSCVEFIWHADKEKHGYIVKF